MYINLETCQNTVVCSVKRLHVIDLALWRENYIRKVFFVTLSCLQRTRCQQKAQHEIVILSICFGRASFVDRSKNCRKNNVIIKLFVWLLQRVAEMVRNLVELFFCKKNTS